MNRPNPTTTNRNLANPTSSMSRPTMLRTTVKRRTKGTTSGTNAQDNEEWVIGDDGKKINVTPKPLVRIRQSAQGQQVTTTHVPGKSGTGKPGETTTGGVTGQVGASEKPTSSIATNVESSYAETSEDQEAKRRDHDKDGKGKKDRKVLTQAELEEYVEIFLEETPTYDIFRLPSIVVATGTDQHKEVQQLNAKYDHLKQTKIGSDSFYPRAAQTFNLQQKIKQVDTTKDSNKKDIGISASKWDIHDITSQKQMRDVQLIRQDMDTSVHKIMDEKLKKPGSLINADALVSHISINSRSLDKSGKQSHSTSKSNNPAAGATMTNQSRLGVGATTTHAGGLPAGATTTKSVIKESTRSGASDKNSTSKDASGTQGQKNQEDLAEAELLDIPLPDSLLKPIKIIERLLTQTEYHEQHVLYKNYPVVKIKRDAGGKDGDDQGADGGPQMFLNLGKTADQNKEDVDVDEEQEEDTNAVNLKSLFRFECDLTDGRYVSGLDWNSANPDLLAVAYGQPEPDSAKPGIIAFWTLKNPSFPEKIFFTPNCLTCCQFSKRNPNLIAVGDTQGNISIFDIKRGGEKPIVTSRHSPGKHTDTVWQVRWVDRGDKGQVLVSISADGQVIEWSMRKGLQYNTLMTLKAHTSSKPGVSNGNKEGMIFIHTSGLSIDFPSNDISSYYAATEDCMVHRCGVSYNEQYLNSHYGHSGPVYRVRCNPFMPSCFATCSYDWTIKIWQLRQEDPVSSCTPQNLTQQINDIEWSPYTSSIFAIVTNDGRLEVWDLAKDTMHPVVQHFDEQEQQPKQAQNKGNTGEGQNEGQFGDDDQDLGNKAGGAEDEKNNSPDKGGGAGGQGANGQGNQEAQNLVQFKTTPKTAVRFNRKDPVIVTGNSSGVVDLYRVFGLDHVQVSNKDQVNRLHQALHPNELGMAQRPESREDGKKSEGEGEEGEEAEEQSYKD